MKTDFDKYVRRWEAAPWPDQLPLHAYDLIQTLADALPPRCPNEGEPQESYLRYVGQVELVDALLQQVVSEINGDAEDPDGSRLPSAFRARSRATTRTDDKPVAYPSEDMAQSRHDALHSDGDSGE